MDDGHDQVYEKVWQSAMQRLREMVSQRIWLVVTGTEINHEIYSQVNSHKDGIRLELWASIKSIKEIT